MDFHVWLEYLLRFAHLVTGIAWIGSSFYFIWLDSSFEVPSEPRRNVEGELFMVHGGFYYQVEKRKIFPGELPKVLHWFKWEATLTWITGMLLLGVVYFLRGASLLIDPGVRVLSQWDAIGLSLAAVIGSWILYDGIWHPRFARAKTLSTVLSALLLAGLIYGLTRVFSGRGAYILTGAILGTLMLLNVWVRILPGQAKMVADAQAGRTPDYTLSLKSKTRSVHNTYFTFPVLFIMLSNHYPALYNHAYNGLLLIALGISGALARHAMVTKKPIERWTLLPAALLLLGLVYATGYAMPSSRPANAVAVDYETQIRPIVANRCVSCHSSQPTDDIYKVAPNGIQFETEAQLRSMGERLHLHVILAKSMPLGNKTGMTDEERTLFGDWLAQEKLGPR